MLCRAAGIDFEPVLVNLRAGENKEVCLRFAFFEAICCIELLLQTAFKAINPAGLVPAIEDDGFFLAESAAILAYLCDSRGLDAWYPKDLKTRARVNSWM